MNLLGKLSLSAIPLDQPIVMGATAFMVLLVAGILGWVTLKGYWSYLWREWLTSVDHKRIGVMYIVLALLMLLRGFSDAIMMRAQQRSRPVLRKATCRRSTSTRSSRRMARS